MRDIIQNMIFPEQENLKDHYKLYYRGTKGVLKKEDGVMRLMLPKYAFVEFNTYFNGLSLRKWTKYTGVTNITFHMTACGKFHLRLCEYHMDLFSPVKTVYAEQDYELPEMTEITVAIPEAKEQMVGFELETESECILCNGYYEGEFSETREINLAISTTTMKKEAFIKANVKALKEQILDSKLELADHLFVHVVDNGRTLSKEDFPEDPHIYLHPNKNTGGAGGFARGMIECMHQEENITHVLLMDDDIIMQPEGFNKTYTLLKHLKPEFQKRFVSGAMLYMEEMNVQKEDVGTVQPDGNFIPLKDEFDHEDLQDNLLNEKHYVEEEHSYAAWWYCCIPMETIREKGLPLPVFVRGDDVEYGLRCKPGFITMNGICVWHMGFAGKFNVAMDHYQVNRNLLIDQASSDVLQGVDVMRKARLDFRKHLLRFDYDSAELALRAIEDFLKGPGYIKEDIGEKILKDNNQYVHQMIPLEQLGKPAGKAEDLEEDIKIDPATKLLYRGTYNGQMAYKGPYKTEPMAVPFNDTYTPGRIAFRTKLYAINSKNQTGYILERDNQHFAELFKRYKKAMSYYNKHKEQLEQNYRKARDYFITEKFWRKYLEI